MRMYLHTLSATVWWVHASNNNTAFSLEHFLVFYMLQPIRLLSFHFSSTTL